MTIDSGADVYQGFNDLTVSLDDGVLAVTVNRPDSLKSSWNCWRPTISMKAP